MNFGRVLIDKGYIRSSPVDDRLFSAFVEHLGNVIYNGIYNPSHETARQDGFRQDVISLVKELQLAYIRYPGGNYICSYNWEDTVGPVECRPKRLELAWQQIEPNIVGLSEFEQWVKAVGSQLFMAVNLSTRGAVDAANLVEYCNHPQGTYYSDLRRLHGHEQPYGIKTWCVGNEVDGPWNIGRKKAEVYAWDAAEAAKAMRRVDETIELVAVGSSGTQLDTYPEWDRIVLMDVYESCDYLSLHRYLGNLEIDNPNSYDPSDTGDYLELAVRLERNIMDILAACDYVKGCKRSNKTMYLSVDEYNVVDVHRLQKTPADETGRRTAKWQTGATSGAIGLSMEATLLFGLTMLILMRHSDRIKIACQSILIGESGLVVCEPDEPAWVNGTYYIFQQCSRYGRGKVLEQIQSGSRYSTKTCSDVSALDSVCIYHEAQRELDVFVVNKAAEPMDFSLQTSLFEALEPIEHIIVAADSLDARNSAVHPDAIRPQSVNDICIKGTAVNCQLPGHSWNVIRLKEV